MINSIKDAFSRLSSRTATQSYQQLESNKKILFEEIIHQDAVKRIFIKALLSNEPIHILLAGTPGSAKSLFLTEIMRCFKSSLFVVGSNSTKAGLINQLFDKLPQYLLIDELDKMNAVDQASLLNLMESGLISETKINKTREQKLTLRVFAAANSADKVIEPLLSRFMVLQLPEYTFEEFRQIGVSRLKKLGFESRLANAIVDQVWNQLHSKNIRDVLKIGKLADSAEDAQFIISMMQKTRVSNRAD